MQDYEKEHEKNAFKAMTVREKADHIWTYYKVPILVIIFLVFFVGWWINHLFINPPLKTGFSVIAYGGAVDGSAASVLQEEYKKKLPQFLGEREQFSIQTFNDYHDEVLDYEQKMASALAIMARVTTGEVDVIVGDRETMEKLISSEYFMPLEQLFDEDEWEEIQKLAARRAETSQKDGEKKNVGVISAEILSLEDPDSELAGEHPYLLCIGGCKSEEKLFYDLSTPYLGVVSNSPHLDKVKEYIWYLMES